MTNVVPFGGGQIKLIPIDKIIEDPFLPRKTYSPEALESLGASMSDKGLMQPIIVSELPDGGFRLVAGGRRIRAARARGFAEIWAVVRDNTCPQDVMILALTENVQREELEPLEEANAYLWLCREYDMTSKDIASSVHKTTGHVRNRLKLLDLAPEVLQLVADDALSASTAALLAHVQSGEEQLGIAQEAVRSGLSDSEVRTLVREEGQRPIESRPGRLVSVQKYRLHIVGMYEKIAKSFAAIEKTPMTAEERGRLMKVHLELEEVSKRIRDKISAGGRVVMAGNQRKGSGNVPTARNHGDEWPAGHVRLFEDSTLTDEDIAEQTGRSVTAVAAMRKELKRTKKRAR